MLLPVAKNPTKNICEALSNLVSSEYVDSTVARADSSIDSCSPASWTTAKTRINLATKNSPNICHHVDMLNVTAYIPAKIMLRATILRVKNFS